MLANRHAVVGDERRLSHLSLVAIAFIAIVVGAYLCRIPLGEGWEDLAMIVNPTASRAYTYGVRHFDAQDPRQYDVARAERMFRIAARLDPNTPYVYHELARIEFLHGRFQEALQLIQLQIERTGDNTPNSYYVKGLIEGYMGAYDAAIQDYSHFLTFDPNNWAGMNDFAWVLLKANRPKDALAVIRHGLDIHPGNPWLLNSYTIALYETGDFASAQIAAQEAVTAANTISVSDWLTAYPGNDPLAAVHGIAQLKAAASENMNRVELALSTSTLQ